MKKIFKILLKALLAFIIAAILYFAAAYILGKIPQDGTASDGDVTLYLHSNGVHADVVMPLSDDLLRRAILKYFMLRCKCGRMSNGMGIGAHHGLRLECVSDFV